MKVKLTERNLVTFFTVYECCGTKQYVSAEGLKTSDEVTCCECGRPIMFRSQNGLWYCAGPRVFE